MTKRIRLTKWRAGVNVTWHAGRVLIVGEDLSAADAQRIVEAGDAVPVAAGDSLETAAREGGDERAAERSSGRGRGRKAVETR